MCVLGQSELSVLKYYGLGAKRATIYRLNIFDQDIGTSRNYSQEVHFLKVYGCRWTDRGGGSPCGSFV